MLLEGRCSLRFTKLEKRSPAMAKVATRVPTSHPSPIAAAQLDVANRDTTMPRSGEHRQCRFWPTAADEPNRQFVATSRRRKTRRVGQTVEPSCSERMSEIPVPCSRFLASGETRSGPLSVDKRKQEKRCRTPALRGSGAPAMFGSRQQGMVIAKGLKIVGSFTAEGLVWVTA